VDVLYGRAAASNGVPDLRSGVPRMDPLAVSLDGQTAVAPPSNGRRPAAPDRRRSVRDEDRRYVWRLRVVDALMACVAGLVGYYVRFDVADEVDGDYAAASLAFPVVWLTLLGVVRAYEWRYLYLGTEEFRRVLRAGVSLALGAAVVSYTFDLGIDRGYLLVVVVLATTATLASRAVLRRGLHRERSSGMGVMCRVVVAGHEDAVSQVLKELGRSRSHGYEVTGVCLADCDARTPFAVPVVGDLEHIADAATQSAADAVIVLPCTHLSAVNLRRLDWRLERDGIRLLVAPGLVDVARARTTVCSVGGLPLLHVQHAELSGARRLVKDVFDRIAAALGLVVLAPFLVALIVAIRLDSPGPAVFRQERVGRDGRRFTLLKLRTMTLDAEDRRVELTGSNDCDGALFKLHDDPRTTRLGRLLRRYSLDELPQLLNIVRGQMSLVGPRPPLPSEVDSYEQDMRRRLVVKPGLTGLWQVSGRSDLPWDDAVRLDLCYVDNWSLLLDMIILCKTWPAVLRRSGAY